MRTLAIFAGAFSAAVFAANFVLPEGLLLPVSFGLALLSPVFWLILRREKDRRLRLTAVLICVGLALGFGWTAVYLRVCFQPARALDRQTVRLTAVVSDWPQETDYGRSVLAEVDTGGLVHVTTLFYLDEQGAELRPGDRITTVAHCTLGDRTLAGEEITYYTAKGIFLRAEAYGRLDVQRPERIPLRCWAACCAKALKAGIDEAFPQDVAPVIRALVTGNRDNLSDEFTTSLQRTGLSHTVAVSGMHLAFLASMVSAALGRGKRSTALMTMVWVLLFCGVAGGTPSVLRAAVMLLMLQLAPLLGRERDDLTALAFSLMLLLLWNPFSAAHLGLQLSFGAVAGILLVSDGIQDRMLGWLRLDRRPGHWLTRQVVKLPRFFIATLSATLGASVLTIPLVAVYFQSFSLIAPLSNLLTLWAVALLFLGGLFLGSLGIVWPVGAAVLATPFTALARYLDWIVSRLSRFSLSALPLNSFYYRAWIVFLCLLIAATLVIKGRKRLILPVCAGGITLAVSLCFTAMTFQSGELTTAVLDVGQGQSVLLRAGSYLALVDCGGDGPDNAGDVAADYIQSMGRASLELLVVSHCHADHANGITQLLRRIDVDVLALPEAEGEDGLRTEILKLAEERGVEIRTVGADTRLSLGQEREITLFAPMSGGEDANEQGLTVLVSVGDFDVLLTGDMSGEGEQKLLAHTELPDIELLIAGHHGSKYSSTVELLDTVRPEMAVISVGAHNRYGHPAQETLERLDAVGAKIYRTDLHGTTVIRSDHWREDAA